MVEHKYIKEALLGFKKVMDKAGILFWLEYGTQLGAVRDGKIIEWDLDGDVGVWLEDIEKMKKLEAEFRKEGMYVAFQKDHLYLNYMIDKERGTFLSVVDIYTFVIEERNNRYWVVRWENGKLFDVKSPAFHYRQFEPVKFLGTYFRVPILPEKTLEFAYGKNWRVPTKKAGLMIQVGSKDPDDYGAGRTHHKKLEDMK